jgi:crossover junction endodeoxyribonuclease RusA
VTLTDLPAPGIARPPAWRIALEPGIKLLNENETRRMHWRRVRELAAAVRQAGYLAGRQARLNGLPPMQRAHVFFVIHPNARTVRRDPANWSQSAKAAVDGALVDTGLLPDDDSTRLLGPEPRLGAPVKGSQLVLIVTDLDLMHPDHIALLTPPGDAR